MASRLFRRLTLAGSTDSGAGPAGSGAERAARRDSDAGRRAQVPAPRPRRTTRRTRMPICLPSRRCCRCRPTEEAKRFWLPAGLPDLTPILSDPVIEDPAQIAFDGNGRMFVVELRGYYPDAGGHRSHSADRADLDARGSRQRRRLRTPLGVRRQAGLSAVRDAVRRQHAS